MGLSRSHRTVFCQVSKSDRLFIERLAFYDFPAEHWTHIGSVAKIIQNVK
jgi:hypothetical protein